MAVPSSLDRSARLRFAFQNTKDSLEQSRQLTGYKEMNRLSSPILRSVASPVSRLSNVQSPDPGLVDEIIHQIRRINPEFTSSTTGLNQNVGQSLKRAVDSILEVQGKSRSSETEKLKEHIQDLTRKLEEANRKIQEGSDSDRKMTLREERLALEEIKLITEKKHLQNEKNQINTLKKNYLQLEAELKQANDDIKALRMDNMEKENRIQELMDDCIQKELEIESLKNSEAPELGKIQELQEQLSIETENLLLRSKDVAEREEQVVEREEKLMRDLLDLDSQKKEVKNQLEALTDLKVKLQEESDFFEQSNKELASFKVTIEIEKNKLKEAKQALELEKAEIAATQRALTTQKSQLLEEVEDLEQQKLDFVRSISRAEEDLQPKVDYFELSPQKEKVSLDYFPHLHSLITDTVSELSNWTIFIQKWLNSLQERELSFESRLDELKLVLALLTEKSQSSSPDSTETEPLLSIVKDLLSEISIKRLILEGDSQGLMQEALETCGFDYLGTNTQVLTELLTDFEAKANELQFMDEHLHEINEKLAVQAEENSRVARFLMEDRIQFETEKAENKKEIEAATETLLQIQAKAELTLEQMNRKEKEVLALQQTIDCRSPFSDDFSASLN